MAYFYCSFIIYVELCLFVEAVGFGVSKCHRIYSERAFQLGYSSRAKDTLRKLLGLQNQLPCDSSL